MYIRKWQVSHSLSS
uniref:Uncharacterized protein n=1 Tax=Anguilla anguilla TaxID=7936 RepID=A0A0E9PHJ9_ANGAN